MEKNEQEKPIWIDDLVLVDIQRNTARLTKEWVTSIKSGIERHWLDLAVLAGLAEARKAQRENCMVWEYRRIEANKNEGCDVRP